MLGGIIAFIFGALEALLLKRMLSSATSGNFRNLAICLLIKFVTYGAAIALLVLLFSEHIVSCAIGYMIGLPAVTAAWFIYKNIKDKKPASEGELKRKQ